MASVKGSSKSGGGKLCGINIEIKANGFEVTKRFEPKLGKGGFPVYEGEKPKDSMVFTTPGEMLTYLESCVGAKEHAAHEASEKY